MKGRIDSVAPGTEGDWAAIDGVVERISPAHVQIRGEVAFRVAKVMKGTPCKVGGTLHFKRSGKSQVWRLAEGDNPCDGAQEMFDLVYEKPVEKKPVPAQPKRVPRAASSRSRRAPARRRARSRHGRYGPSPSSSRSDAARAAASRRCHSSTFFTGFLSAVRQPFFFQPWIHLVTPSST